MRVFSGIALLFVFLLVVGCSSQDVEVVEGNTSDNSLIIDGSINFVDDLVSNDEIIDDVVVVLPEQTSHEKYDSIENSRLQFSSIQIQGDVYDRDDPHELRLMITNLESLSQVRVDFVPWCDSDDDERLFLQVNRNELASQELVCGENNSILVPISFVVEGFNRFTLRAFARNDYFLDQVGVVLVKKDGTQELLEGKQLTFKKTSSSRQTLSSLTSIIVDSVFERTFTVDRNKLSEDLTLEFRSSIEERELVVVLNEYVVFEGVVDDRNKVTLPRELLLHGTNKLLFVIKG